jgi:hypothetical protein
MYLAAIGALCAASESVAGADAAPSASNYIEAFNPSISFPSELVELERVAKRSLGNMAHARSWRLRG